MLNGVGYVLTFYSCTVEKVYPVGYAVELVEHYSAYAGLYDEFGAVKAW